MKVILFCFVLFWNICKLQEEVKVATPSGKRGRTDSDKPEKKPKKAKESTSDGKPGAAGEKGGKEKDSSGGTPGKPKVKSIHVSPTVTFILVLKERSEFQQFHRATLRDASVYAYV